MSKQPQANGELTPAQKPFQAALTEGPRRLEGAKLVEWALITYTDASNQQVTQLALVGDNNVHLIESRSIGISKNSTPQGPANPWLRDQILKALGKQA